jgi:hypothetical protein
VLSTVYREGSGEEDEHRRAAACMLCFVLVVCLFDRSTACSIWWHLKIQTNTAQAGIRESVDQNNRTDWRLSSKILPPFLKLLLSINFLFIFDHYLI